MKHWISNEEKYFKFNKFLLLIFLNFFYFFLYTNKHNKNFDLVLIGYIFTSYFIQ